MQSPQDHGFALNETVPEREHRVRISHKDSCRIAPEVVSPIEVKGENV